MKSMSFHNDCFLYKFTIFPKVLLFVKQTSKIMHSILLTVLPRPFRTFIIPDPCILSMTIYIVIHPFPFICITVLVPVLSITVSHPFYIVAYVLAIRVKPSLVTFAMDFIIEKFSFVNCVGSNVSTATSNMASWREPTFKKCLFFFVNNQSSSFRGECCSSNWIYTCFCLTKIYVVLLINELSNSFLILLLKIRGYWPWSKLKGLKRASYLHYIRYQEWCFLYELIHLDRVKDLFVVLIDFLLRQTLIQHLLEIFFSQVYLLLTFS